MKKTAFKILEAAIVFYWHWWIILLQTLTLSFFGYIQLLAVISLIQVRFAHGNPVNYNSD
jgi:hypothetical protein